MSLKRERETEECFLLYDYPKKGKVPNSKLIELMNALGQNTTETELKSLIKKADPYNDGYFTMDGFKKVMGEFSNIQYTRTDLQSAYELLDRDQDGFISKADLKNASKLLLGSPLENDKIEFMFNNLKITDDKINFD